MQHAARGVLAFARMVQAAQQQHELVAPQARGGVAGADTSLQTARHLGQQVVASVVAVRVVHGLEAVQVHETHRQPLACPLRTGQALLQAVCQQGTVGQAGQGVEVRQAFQLFLLVLALGDVGEHADVVRDLPIRIAQRVDGAGGGIQAAVLVPVPELALPVPVLVQCLPHGGVLLPAPAPRGEQAGLAPQDLGGTVASDAGEGRIDFDDALRGIADHHPFMGVGHHARSQAQGLLGLLGGGDVLLDTQVVGDAALVIDQRRDGGIFDIQLAALAPVDELALPDPARHQFCPHGLVGGLAGLARLQHARIGPQHLGRCIAGGMEEMRVGVLDGRGRGGDDDAGGALLHGQRQLADGGLVGTQPREVVQHAHVVDHAARAVADGIDRQPAGQRRAVLAPVDDLALPCAFGGHGGPHGVEMGGHGVRGGQMTGQAPRGFGCAEARAALERGVDGDDAPLPVGDNDEIIAMREHAGGEAVLLQAPLLALQRAVHAPGQGTGGEQHQHQGQSGQQDQLAHVVPPPLQHLRAGNLRQHEPGVGARSAEGHQPGVAARPRPLVHTHLALQCGGQARGIQHGAGKIVLRGRQQQRALVGVELVAQRGHGFVVQRLVDEVVAVDGRDDGPLRCLGQHQGDREKAGIACMR